MSTSGSRRRRAVLGSIIVSALTLAVSAKGWGSWAGLLGHPARAGAMVVMLVTNVAAAFSPLNFSTGKRKGGGDIRAPLVGTVVGFFGAWLLPHLDSRDVWVVDGDVSRWFGLALCVAGAVLRVWPMFVLGPRFSAFVAIQERHELVTGGLYRAVRHPSYLGGLIGFAGWALVFRSVAGLGLWLVLLWTTVARMNAEEAVLATEFGGAYAAYRERTWRLVPRVY